MDKKISNLSCQQIYEIWRTEPELVELLDLRTSVEFLDAHIPGAINIPYAINFFDSYHFSKNKLTVLLCPGFEDAVKNDYIQSKNCNAEIAFMNNCHEWINEGRPIIGKSIENINRTFKEISMNANQDVIFFQLFEHESSTFTYIIADKKTKEAAIIDPVIETFDRDRKLIEELDLKLVYILDTHVHADHITAANELRKCKGAKTAVSSGAGVQCVDINLEDGQELLLGNKTIKAIATPGHTDSCMSFYFEGRVFSGDTLLIRGCGRTDFQQGSNEKLFHSVREKLFKLPEDTVVYPAHDYRGFTASTIALEKTYNPRLKLTNSFEDFKKIMNELNLAYPKKIDASLPANLACGNIENNRMLHPQTVNGIPEVTVKDVLKAIDTKKDNLLLIDVRRPDEFDGELGHIAGAKLLTLGEDLTKFLETNDRNAEIVFICRSGARSANATSESIKLGYKKSVNMIGGMLLWNEEKYPTVKK